MDATIVGLIGIAALLVLIFMGMNIGMALMSVGFIGFAAMTNVKAAISILSTVPSTQAGRSPSASSSVMARVWDVPSESA